MEDTLHKATRMRELSRNAKVQTVRVVNVRVK